MLEIDLHNCKLVTSRSITDLLAHGRQLRELRVNHCKLITDQAFLELPKSLSFESLRILDLTGCEQLHDEAVEKIIDTSPRLRNLVLAKCREVTDRSVIAITKLGKNLHYIHLGHCGNINDDAVIQLVKLCNRIRYIDLACCHRLTDASVQQLAQLPKLRRIGLVKCHNISDRSITALAKSGMRRPAKPVVPSLLERVHLSYCLHLTLGVGDPHYFDVLAANCSIGHTRSFKSVPQTYPSKFDRRCSLLHAGRPYRILSRSTCW